MLASTACTTFTTVKRPYPKSSVRSADTELQTQIRRVWAAISIQRLFRGYIVRKDLKAVRTIFNQIQDEIHYQVFGEQDKHSIKEKMVLDLKSQRELLVRDQQLILEAFYKRLAGLEMI